MTRCSLLSRDSTSDRERDEVVFMGRDRGRGRRRDKVSDSIRIRDWGECWCHRGSP